MEFFNTIDTRNSHSGRRVSQNSGTPGRDSNRSEVANGPNARCRCRMAISGLRLVAATTLLFAGSFPTTSVHAASIPCRLDSSDYDALAHARKRECDTCILTPQHVARLDETKLRDLCAARAVMRDLHSQSADQFSETHPPGKTRQDWSYYITDAERTAFNAMVILSIEKLAARDPASWHTYRYADLGLAIDLPDLPPTRQHLNLGVPGLQVPTDLILDQVFHLTVSVTVEKIPTVLRGRNDFAFLDKATAAGIAKLKGTLLSRSYILVSGFPAVAFELRLPDGSKVRGRYVYAGGRLYSLLMNDLALAPTRPSAHLSPGFGSGRFASNVGPGADSPKVPSPPTSSSHSPQAGLSGRI